MYIQAYRQLQAYNTDTDIYKHIKHIQVYTDIYRQIQAYTCIYRQIPAYTGIYWHIHVYTDIYWHIHVYTGIYMYIHYTGIYRQLQAYKADTDIYKQ